MTSLDANALVNDAEGLDFLARVLDHSASSGCQLGSFDISAPRHGWTIAGGDIDVSRSSANSKVAEAA